MRYMTTISEITSKPQRRTFLGGAVAALLAPRLSRAAVDEDEQQSPGDPFIVLLKGIYQPVPLGKGPLDNLKLTTVNLSDGSYSTTQIFPVYHINGSDDPNEPIGRFFVQF